VAGDIASSTRNVKELYREATDASDGSATPVPLSDDPSVRFEEANAFYRRSPGDIERLRVMAYRKCYVSWFMALVCCGLTLMSLCGKQFPGLGPQTIAGGVAGLVLGLATVALSVAKALQNGLFFYQLTNRKLITFRQYMQDEKKEWMPSMRTAGRTLAVAALLALGVSTTPAMADSSSSTSSVFSQVFTTPSTTDLWAKSLSYIFPHIGPLSNMGSTGNMAGLTGLSAAMSIFLSVLMAFGIAMLSWHVITGMVATAHEGKVLGGRAHTVWAPIRVLYGIGMLSPAVNGFCMAQVLALYLSVWSGQAASLIWYTYVDSMTSVSASLLNGYALNSDTAYTFARSELCYWTLSDLNTANGYGSSVVLPTHPTGTAGEATTGISDQMVLQGTSAYTSLDSHYYDWDYGFCGTLSGVFTDQSNSYNSQVAAFDESRLQAVRTMQSSISNAAQTMAALVTQTDSSGSNTTSSAFTSAVSTYVTAIAQANSDYNSAMSSAATTLSTSLASSTSSYQSNLASDAKTYGWMTAGSYYMDLSRLQTVAYNADNRSVRMVKDFNYMMAATDDWDQLENPKTGAIAYIDKALLAQEKATDESDFSSSLTSTSTQTGSSSNSNDSEVTNLVMGSMRKFIAGMVGMTSGSVTPGTTGVLQGMVHFGHVALGIGEVIFVSAMFCMLWANSGIIGKTVEVAAAFASSGPAAGAGQTAMAMAIAKLGPIGIGILLGIAGALISVGVIYAYILPMIPFLMFSMFIMHNLIVVAEAVVATPLWAYVHIRSDGQDFADSKQTNGYNMLFNLFLRIPLGIFGLIMSIGLFEAGSWMFEQLYIPAVQSALSDTWSGLMAVITMVFIGCYVHFHLATMSFGVMTGLPTRAAGWIGMGDNRSEESDAGKVHGAAVAIVAKQGASTIRSGANQIISSTRGNVERAAAGAGNATRQSAGTGTGTGTGAGKTSPNFSGAASVPSREESDRGGLEGAISPDEKDL